MKAFFIVFVFFVSALLVVSSASAFSFFGVRGDEITDWNSGVSDFYIHVKNPSDKKIKVEASALIIGTGDYLSRTDYIKKNSGKYIRLSTPENLPKGEYVVKITTKTKDEKRTKYRFINVD